MAPPKPEEIQAIRDKSVAERTHADQRRLHWAEDYWTNEDIQTETTAFYKLNSEVGAPTGHATGHAPFGADGARAEDARINRQRANDVIKRLGPDADPDYVRLVEAHFGLGDPAQGGSMDEHGNWYDAQGRRIDNPHKDPNAHKAGTGWEGGPDARQTNGLSMGDDGQWYDEFGNKIDDLDRDPNVHTAGYDGKAASPYWSQNRDPRFRPQVHHPGMLGTLWDRDMHTSAWTKDARFTVCMQTVNLNGPLGG
ncbi:hypothetical protein [Magnetospira sp. QH-2]|uniref:hypothetical protein n=1 Tax=Magnetospira sp. (strain QH-2) TaxID=1288970 RepID=UPI0003E81C34|nr:hypothetical protein [Magnetospira sp. QH-2]CCQ74792.1 protein of unknown function [Magnetospira sp. QH-2]